MQTFFELLPESGKTAVALGYFDGIHAGHRRVISGAANERQNGLTPVCLTFSESPKSVLQKSDCGELMTARDKRREMEKLSIEHLYFCDFRAVMNISAEDFISRILLDTLKAEKIFCGFNYRFGRNGAGNVELLREICEKSGAQVCVIPPVMQGGDIVSSTLIRGLIKSGDVRSANELLQSHFGFSSEIIHGQHLGRILGTPTINQPLKRELVVPKFGVYASCITLENGEKYCGVTNIGVKPTVGKFSALCETWMPDFSGGEIYGQTADVRLLDFIRDEMKFPCVDALKNAILDNARTAKKIYSDLI